MTGFYDDVIPPQDWEKEELRNFRFQRTEYADFLGVP